MRVKRRVESMLDEIHDDIDSTYHPREEIESPPPQRDTHKYLPEILRSSYGMCLIIYYKI